LKPEERSYFYNWLNAHVTKSRQLLLLFDNLDVRRNEYSALSDILNEFLSSVRYLRILCTCRCPFYRGGGGKINHEIYRLGDVGDSTACALLRCLLPDLHKEGIASLAGANTCDRIPFTLRLVASIFSGVVDIDAGNLFEGSPIALNFFIYFYVSIKTSLSLDFWSIFHYNYLSSLCYLFILQLLLFIMDLLFCIH